MISIWHLLWIIPATALFCVFALSLCMVSKESDDYMIDNSNGHMICRYTGEPCSKKMINVYEDNCSDCINKPFDGEFPDWCKEEKQNAKKRNGQ